MSNFLFINHYASTPSTGMGGRTHYLARELARMGHDVTVVAAGKHHLLRDTGSVDVEAQDELVSGYRFLRIDIPHYSNAHDKRRILAWFVFTLKLLGLRKRLGSSPDAILYSSPQPIGFLAAQRLAKNFRSRLIFEVRDIWPLTLVEIGGYSPSHPFIRFLQWIEDRAYSKADRVVSNLKNSVEHMVTRGMERRKFSWIPNGFAMDEVEGPAPLSLEVAGAIPKDGLRIAYVGTLGVANALHILIDAASLLRDLPDVSFVLVGQGREREALERRCKELGLDNVQFLGSVAKAEVQSVLAACDACYIGLPAAPLFRFGVSPNKLFEYLISGKPILYGIESGEFRPVEEYNAGIQFDAEDPKALANAIRFLRNLPEDEWRKMGENGQKAALEHFDYAKLAQQLEAVLAA